MSHVPGAAAPGVELDALLLGAKLAVPQPRLGVVSRAELIAKARGSDCRVVGITAPAGYGKSTLLAEWAQAETRRVAWVSLDRFDDDPATLVWLLASAYGRATPGLEGLAAEVGGSGVSVLGRAAPRLASAFQASPDPFVLMLDDLHELRSPACHDVLEVAISGIPRGSQLVAASRGEQPHLPRLRAEGETLELVTGDLALDAEGAELIFSRANVPLTSALAAAVTERTEGWPVGLHLAALIAQDGAEDVVTISGDDRYVADYLYGEALSRQPEELQQFLRRTAVLDELSGPLCDAVLDDQGAQERLRRLEASNLFLIPLDRRREWYRYHALFREFLLSELRRVEPDHLAKLHLRAADWFEANGSPVKAIEHLLSTTEPDRAVQLVAALALPTYQAGQLTTVRRWLAALGDAAIEGYPPLAVIAGWITVLTGQTTRAQRWAAIIDAGSFDLAPVDGTASFDSSRAMLRSVMCPAGPEQALADGSLAIAQEPAWSPWRTQALSICGEAQLLAGNAELARALFLEAAAVATDTGESDASMISEANLALLAMDRGDWAEAAEFVQRALGVVESARMEDYATSALAFAAAARLASHRGDRAEANQQLTRAMRARPASTFAMPHFAVRPRLHMAKVYVATDDLPTARHLLREIDDILLHRPALGALVDEVAALHRLLSETPQVQPSGAAPLSPAELRLLPYLQTHLTMSEIGQRLFVSRNTVATQVGSIYRKLGASSRSEAVEIATTMGLLGG